MRRLSLLGYNRGMANPCKKRFFVQMKESWPKMPNYVKEWFALHGAEGGRKGGRARNPNKGFGSLSASERAAVSRLGASLRWAKKKSKKVVDG